MKSISAHLIKGAVFNPSYAHNSMEFWRDYDKSVIERELVYAAKLGFNSLRIFLNCTVYASGKQRFLDNLKHFMLEAHKNGLKVMPVVFDSCFTEIVPDVSLNIDTWIPSPGVMNMGEHYWEEGEEYSLSLINLLKDDPALLMWDIMNEPLCTEYFYKYEGELREKHKAEIYGFLKHFCAFFKAHDSINPITVGHDSYIRNEETGDWVDILSCHDYSPSVRGIDEAADKAVEQGKRLGKQIFNSETGCPGRSNPYDRVIESMNRHKLGYFLWEVMIGVGFWSNRHGLIYPDGTIRDPAAVAALSGFFRNRAARTALVPDIEGYASDIAGRIQKWLASPEKDIDEGLLIADMAANICEGCLLLPESELPSAEINRLASACDIEAALNKWLPTINATLKPKV